MENILFFDTETTGLPGKYGHDARIIQLAALLCTPDGRDIAHLNIICLPYGEWEMTEGAAAVHGKSREFVLRHGVPMAEALGKFHDLLGEADTVVAHNLPFDYQRYAREIGGLYLPDGMLGKERVCTMRVATPICQLPPTEKMIQWGRGGQYKSANLTEAHTFFFGHGFDGAHDALADVKACRNIFFAMKERGAL